MKIPLIIHQQICQLRWHLLACLGLLMLLPIEEAVVNLKEGDGFHSIAMVIAAVTFSPLLAGLIACANVQGDLDEKRYIFWRSKPANVKMLMTIKFLVGLVASLLVLACPLVFAVATAILFTRDRIGQDLTHSAPFFVLMAIMTYSLCFACNVLVRKSARAWLIGMLLAGLLLVLPFILPLNYRDFVTDVMRWTLSAYLVIVLGASMAAFVFSLYATQHDWHLRTNLKGLLWVGAGLLFILMRLLSSQVGNIKILQEKPLRADEIGPSWNESLQLIADRLIFQRRSYVEINKNSISLSNISDTTQAGFTRVPWLDNPRMRTYPNPWSGGIYKKISDDLYSFAIRAEYRREGKMAIYERVHLASRKLVGESWIQAGELDISDCLTNRTDGFRMAMRLIHQTLVVCVNKSFIVVDVTDPNELKRTSTKLDALKMPMPFYPDRQKESAIPLLVVNGINIEEQIRLSIDLSYQFHYGRNDIFDRSIVDIDNGKIAFFLASGKDIARFDVTRWTQKNIYLKLSSVRPFTILEGIMGHLYVRDSFVKGGNLYCYGENTLLVFDIRSNHHIRKLGHFVRMSCSIEDFEVLEDGRILLDMWRDKDLGVGGRYHQQRYLYLLENPA
jgi:hypothetical protein